MPQNKIVHSFEFPDRHLRFTGLLRKVHSSAERYTLSLCRSGIAVTAEDVLQDALVVAWCRFDDLHDEQYFGSWLCGIIRRVHSNHLHKSIRRKQHVQHAAEYGMEVTELAERSPPHFQAMALQQALARLSLPERRALLLYTLGGMKIEELAQMEGSTLEGMKKRLQRARKHMRRFWNEEGEANRNDPIELDRFEKGVVEETLWLLETMSTQRQKLPRERLN